MLSSARLFFIYINCIINMVTRKEFIVDEEKWYGLPRLAKQASQLRRKNVEAKRRSRQRTNSVCQWQTTIDHRPVTIDQRNPSLHQGLVAVLRLLFLAAAVADDLVHPEFGEKLADLHEQVHDKVYHFILRMCRGSWLLAFRTPDGAVGRIATLLSAARNDARRTLRL